MTFRPQKRNPGAFWTCKESAKGRGRDMRPAPFDLASDKRISRLLPITKGKPS
ncbi:hypothetical protein SAMN04515647_3998 [Cohaesibacter sp. ES.047]|nr:hypothetical protein SAMN04515647_3998 [Cohaesibacter sp. ES.047]